MCLQYHTSLTNPSYPVLITGSYDRTVRIWNLETGAEIRQLLGHTRAVRCLQFDQMLLFTGAMDGTVRMWNWRAGDCLRVLEGHSDGVVSLNYNGYLLATGSADSTINVWNFRTGNKFTLRGHEDWVNSVLLWDGKTSPGDMDPTAMPSFTRPRNGNSPAPGSSAARNDAADAQIDPGAMLFSGSDDGTVKLWDLASQTCVKTFTGHKAQIQSIKLIMVDMSDEEVAEQKHRRNMRKRAVSPSQSASESTPTPFIRASSTNVAHSPSPPPTPIDYEPHAHIASGPSGPKVFVHASSEDTKKATKAVQSGPDHRQKKPILATGSLDGTVKLWDVDSGEEISTLFGHIEGVWAVDMDALRMASASHGECL